MKIIRIVTALFLATALTLFNISTVLAGVPTVTFDLQDAYDSGSSSTDDITNATTLIFDATFSEPITDFLDDDLSNAGTASGCLFTVGSPTGDTYPVTVSSCTAGTLIVRLRTNAVTSISTTEGNDQTNGPTVTIDRTAPTVTFDLQTASDTGTSSTDNITNATSPVFDTVFSEAVSGFAAGDLSNIGTATGCSFSVGAAGGNTYPVTVSSCTAGTLIVRLATSGVTDTAGNPVAQTDGPTVTIDRTGPTVTFDLQTTSDSGISSSDNITNATSPYFDAIFNEAISGLAAGDLSNTGTAGGCSFLVGSPTGNTYPINVASCSAGTLIVRLAASGVTDTAGNPVAQTDGPTVTIDRTAPTVTFDLQPTSDSGSSNTDNLTNATSPVFDAAFSEAVYGFVSGSLSNIGTSTGCSFLVGAPSGNTYPVTVSSCTAGTLIVRLAASGVTDTAGNPVAQTDGPTVTIDRTGPTVTFDLQSGSDTGPSNTDNITNAATLVVDAIFSEAISNFQSSSLSNVGSATGCSFFIGSPLVNTYPVSVNNCSAGTLILRLAAGVFVDAAGNANLQTDGPAVTIDRTVPTVTFDLQTASDSGPSNTDNLTNAASPVFDAVFSEAVSGFVSGSLSNAGTATGCSFSIGAPVVNTYPVTAPSCTAGTLIVRMAAGGVTDIAGNLIAQTDGPTVTIERTAPTVTFDLQPGSDTGFSNTDNLTNSTSLVFNAIFSETVSGFISGGLSNVGTATGCVFSIGAPTGNTYPVTVSSCTAGTLIIRLAASGVMDTAGNLNAQTDGPTITIDRTVPVFSSVTPVTGATIQSITTSSAVSYTLSEVIAGGTITMTRTGGTGDAGSPHTCVLTGAALNSGTHNNLDLSNTTNACTVAQSLVNGGIYAFAFNGTDLAGNTAVPVTSTGVTFDNTAPAFSGVAPVTGATINNITTASDVSYTLSKAFASGSITMTRTGGTGDASSPHTCILTGMALNIGVHNNLNLSDTSNACTVAQSLVSGTIYTFVFNGVDSGGNPATPFTSTGVIFDNAGPVFSAVAPLINATINSVTTSSDVSYTLSEALASGTITMTWTGGTADAGSPHTCALTGTALNSGAHNHLDLSDTTDACTVAQSLVSGGIYTFAFNGTDTAGNVAVTVTITGVTFDNTAPVFSQVTPVTNAFINSITAYSDVSYTLSEALTNGSINMIWAGGASDSSHSCTLTGTALSMGVHSNLDLSNTLNACTVAQSLKNGAVYTFIFNGIDLAGNSAVTVTSSYVTFDTTLPVISSVAPASNTYINSITTNSAVSYTINEAMASGSITMTRTGGAADASSPHICTLTGTALAFGIHNNLNLSDTTNACTVEQFLISGTIYTFAFNAADAAGNQATTVTSTGVTYDSGAPVFSLVKPATSGYINSITTASDVSYTLSETLASGSLTMTRTGGAADAGSPHTCTLKGTALNSGVHNNLDLSDTTNACTVAQSLVSGAIYTFSFTGSDSTGNTAVPVTRTSVTFDSTAPLVTWSAPVGDGQQYDVYNQSIQLEVTATDNVGMDKVVFWRWDYINLLWVQIGMVTPPTYSYTFDTRALLPNVNQISVYAYDKAGNSSYKSIKLNHIPTPTLTVTKAGSGTGTVTSSPPGIDCGSTCVFDFAKDAVVTLTPTPTSQFIFGGWTGACSGFGPCILTMDVDKSVIATFSNAAFHIFLPLIVR